MRLWFALLAVFMLLVGFLAVSTINMRGDKDAHAETISKKHEEAQLPFYAETESLDGVLVTRVIDGDTVEIEGGVRLRYIGIDTPETVDPRTPVQCFGAEAARRNRELVEGKRVMIEKDVSTRDKYGRLLGYVYVNGTMVNELLVKEGYARASSYPPDIKYQERFRNAERGAREAGTGLWSGCPPNASSTALALPQEREHGGCVIKGNISSGGKIFHVPGCGSYDKTVIDESRGEHWFCSEEEAIATGWRRAKNCP